MEKQLDRGGKATKKVRPICKKEAERGERVVVGAINKFGVILFCRD